MVKGVSRQVIVVHAQDTEMFDQAIFVLKDNAKPVTDDALLKEAKRLLHSSAQPRRLRGYGPVWACAGAVTTAFIWLLTSLL